MTEFQAANGGNSPDQFAAQAYSGMWILATAIRCGNSVDHAAVNTAIGAIKDFETPLGTFSFDADGEPLLTVVTDLTVPADAPEPPDMDAMLDRLVALAGSRKRLTAEQVRRAAHRSYPEGYHPTKD